MGVLHQTEIVVPHNFPGYLMSFGCRWIPDRINQNSQRLIPARYLCHHAEVCKSCGKQVRTYISPEECPEYHPITDEERTPR